MLRYYQGHGLIEPDYVNESSGRRFYRAEQVKEAALVMRLRAAGFPCAQSRRSSLLSMILPILPLCSPGTMRIWRQKARQYTKNSPTWIGCELI